MLSSRNNLHNESIFSIIFNTLFIYDRKYLPFNGISLTIICFRHLKIQQRETLQSYYSENFTLYTSGLEYQNRITNK